MRVVVNSIVIRSKLIAMLLAAGFHNLLIIKRSTELLFHVAKSNNSKNTTNAALLFNLTAMLVFAILRRILIVTPISFRYGGYFCLAVFFATCSSMRFVVGFLMTAKFVGPLNILCNLTLALNLFANAPLN